MKEVDIFVYVDMGYCWSREVQGFGPDVLQKRKRSPFSFRHHIL